MAHENEEQELIQQTEVSISGSNTYKTDKDWSSFDN